VAAAVRKFRASDLSAADGVVPKRSRFGVHFEPFRLWNHPGRYAATPPNLGGDTRTGRITPTRQLLTWIAFVSASWPVAALAQEEEGPRLIQIPNPMAAHTWFIIAAVGAFLAWCISYVLQFRRNQQTEKSDKARRIALLHEKDELLDRLAQLESEKEAGAIPGPKYEKEYKKARSRLSDVLGRLGGKGDAGEA